MKVKRNKKTNLKNSGLLVIAMALSFFSLAYAGHATTSWTMAEVNTHNSASDCWMAINGKVYNMTSYVPSHPGGAAIIPFCGLDATDAFAGQPMHTYATGLLPTYYIGDLAVPDTTAPVILMNGASPVEVYAGSPYADAGATATDNVDPNVTVNAASTVDTSVIGSYIVTYTATDAAGNNATPVVRTVNVVAVPDTTVPVITLVSPENKTYNTSAVILKALFDKPIDTAWIVLDNGAAQNFANNVSEILVNLSSLSEGAHNLYVYANNSLGAESYSSVFFTTNTTATNPPANDNTCEHKHKNDVKDKGKHKGECKEHKEQNHDEDNDEQESETEELDN